MDLKKTRRTWCCLVFVSVVVFVLVAFWGEYLQDVVGGFVT